MDIDSAVMRPRYSNNELSGIILRLFDTSLKYEGLRGFDLAYPGHPNVHDKTIHAPKVTVTTTLLTDDL